MSLELFCEVLGTLLGLAYLYWEYRADARLWLAGMAMPALSLVVYWRAGLYADFGINVYYLLAAVYGLWIWRRGGGQLGSSSIPITRTPRRMWLPLCLAAATLTALIWALLLHTPSTVPLPDALTTALSIVALWMLSRKFTGQWLVWLAVDVLSTALYAYKGIHFYALLYAFYSVAAVAGYLKWCRMVRAE